MRKKPVIGKTTSIADIVKLVRYEVSEQAEGTYSLPGSSDAISQFLFLFQSSGDPNELDNFVDCEFTSANIWVQMKSGDNQKMTAVERDVADFAKKYPPPVGFTLKWAGLTYLNVVWQEKMVVGMMRSFLGSFLIVFLLMAFLFRSLVWGLASMIPLTFTIAMSYGFIGIVGKDYDMPLAVLSSMTLGIAVDYAIHFLQRFKQRGSEGGAAREVVGSIFNGPALAIMRNAVIIAIGFTSLLFAPLTSYETVGVYLFTIMLLSGIATLILLPGVISLFEKYFFKEV